MSDFETKTDYLIETKGLLKDRINSLGGSITSGTTFRDYLVWLDSLYEALEEKTITGLPDSLEGKCEQTGTPTPSSPIPINITTGRQVVSVCGKNLFSSGMELGTIDNTTGQNANNNSCIRSIDYIKVQPNTTYTIGSTMNYHVLVHEYKADKTYIQYDGNYGSPRTFTTTSNTYYIRVRSSAGQVENDLNAKYQLELGSTPSAYEEYKGNDYEINLGKNLFNGTLYNTQVGSNGGITSSTTRVANVEVGGTSITYIPQGTYTLSIENLDYCSVLTKQESTIIDNFATSWHTLPFTFTTTQGAYLYFTGRKSDNSTISPDDYSPQLEKGSSASSFSPYKTPIYLGKIGNYKDYIDKNTGTNMWNNTLEVAEYNSNGEKTTSTVWLVNTEIIQVQPNTKYTVSQSQHPIQYRVVYFNSNTYLSQVQNGINTTTGYTNYTFTTPNNCNGIYIQFRSTTERIATGTYNVNIADLTNIMLNKGSTALPYEPYGEGQWYIHKEIGRVVLNGSENWTTRNGGTSYAYMLQDVFDKYRTTGLCNYFRFIEGGASGSQTTECIASANTNGTASIFTNNSSLNTLANFKTWLSSHNVEVYYVLNTPTNTLIEDEELINQLNEIEIFTVISEDFYN